MASGMGCGYVFTHDFRHAGIELELCDDDTAKQVVVVR